MIHRLKTLPNYWDAIEAGDKTFEIRNNSDRGFQKGDTVILQKYDGVNGTYYYDAENEILEIIAKITYVTNYAQKENYVVFGLSVIR